MKKEIYKFLAILALGALVVFLSACGGGVSANGNPSSINELYLDHLGRIPVGAKGLSIFRMHNESREQFNLLTANIIPLSDRTAKKLATTIDASSCKVITAGQNCLLQADLSKLEVGSYLLEAILQDKNGNKLAVSQMIEIVKKEANTNKGIELLGYNGAKIIARNDGYHINLPVILHNNYESMITSQGKLECNHGFESEALCNWLIDGVISKENTVLQLSLGGYDKHKQKTATSYQLRVTNSIQANLLLSEIADIEIGTTPENSEQLVIFNAGNYSASNIALSVLPETDLELVSNECSGIALRPLASCLIQVRAINGNRNGHGIVEVTYNINPDGDENSVNGNILYYTNGVTTSMNFEYINGESSNFIVGEANRSLVYRLVNSGQNDIKDISLAVSNGRIATATVEGENSCTINGKLGLSIEESCVFQANLALNDMKPQVLTAQGTYQDEHDVSREITSSDIVLGYMPPKIAITPVSNWQTVPGVPSYTFTATISGGRSTITPTVTGIDGATLSPVSCALDSQISYLKSCTFIVIPISNASSYPIWDPANIANSHNPELPTVISSMVGVELSATATNNATINGSSTGLDKIEVSASIVAPYVYLRAPNEGAATESNTGITWSGTEGTIVNRFVPGKNSSGNDCPLNQEIINDTLTGLSWVASPTTTAYSWDNAVKKGVGGAIPDSYCGYHNWRLPNVIELQSLINYYEVANKKYSSDDADVTLVTWFGKQGFGNISSVGGYWTSTPGRDSTNQTTSYYIRFSDAAILSDQKRTVLKYVWAVRDNVEINPADVTHFLPKTGPSLNESSLLGGKQWPNIRFSINGDCITDNLTGLMWAKNGMIGFKATNGDLINQPNYQNTDINLHQIKFSQRNKLIEKLNNAPISLCGYKDWHLPNILELSSLINYSSLEQGVSAASSLNNSGFKNVMTIRYLTSTLTGGRESPYGSYGWAISFVNGYHGRFPIDGDANYAVLPVRGGT